MSDCYCKENNWTIICRSKLFDSKDIVKTVVECWHFTLGVVGTRQDIMASRDVFPTVV